MSHVMLPTCHDVMSKGELWRILHTVMFSLCLVHMSGDDNNVHRNRKYLSPYKIVDVEI